MVGAHIIDGLRSLAEKHSIIGDVRGRGLFVVVELVSDRDQRTPATALTRNIVDGLKNRGVLVGSIGVHANILKIRPPMVLSIEQASYMLDILDETLSAFT